MSQCSILGLDTTNGRRRFVFYKPEKRERGAAKKTPVLFDGSSRYVGKLSLLDGSCGGKSVAVNGEVTNEKTRVTFTIADKQLAAVCPAYRGSRTVVLDLLYGSMTLPTTNRSVRARNWGAVTPQGDPAKYEELGYRHIRQWPTYLPSGPPSGNERDAEDHIVPAFGSRVAGAGLWWHWMRVRGKYAPTQRISLLELAKQYAGEPADTAPKVKAYLERYALYSCFYFGRRLSERDPIDLGLPDERWSLAQLMFHHEAGFKVDLTRQEFESGVRLAEDFIAQRVKPISEYDPNYQ